MTDKTLYDLIYQKLSTCLMSVRFVVENRKIRFSTLTRKLFI